MNGDKTRNPLPADFDWVTERHLCSPSAIITKLRMQIETDIEKRKELLTPAERARLAFSLRDEDRLFVVQVEGQNNLYRGVRFGLTYTGITVHDVVTGRQLYEATSTLSDDGECRLRIGEKEYDLWQFRKLALQDIFFGHDVIYAKTEWA